MAVRNRVVEMKMVRVGDIIPAPWNPRVHGEQQRNAVQGSLDELGITDALKVRTLEDGRYMLWDGHLRQDLLSGLDPDTEVPVIVTDLDEKEAKKAVLVHDPLGAMADTNDERMRELIEEVGATSSDALAALIDSLAQAAALPVEEPPLPAPAAESPPAETPAETVEAPAPTPQTGFRVYSVAVLPAQERIIRSAVLRSKARHGLESPGDALAAIVREWAGTVGEKIED